MGNEMEGSDKIQDSDAKTIEIIVKMFHNDGSIAEKTIFTIHNINQYNAEKMGETRKLIFPELEIHLKEQSVYYRKELISLSRYEFYTLCFLAQHSNWVFSKEQIYGKR